MDPIKNGDAIPACHVIVEPRGYLHEGLIFESKYTSLMDPS